MISLNQPAVVRCGSSSITSLTKLCCSENRETLKFDTTLQRSAKKPLRESQIIRASAIVLSHSHGAGGLTAEIAAHRNGQTKVPRPVTFPGASVA